ncbi:MAG: hypothetical protein WCO00_13570 [Rhodospirillaceae bacterium]
MSETAIIAPYVAIVLGGSARLLVRGFVQGDVFALFKGVAVLGLGLCVFIIAALFVNGHTAGAIAASAVIGPMTLGGFLIWHFVLRRERPAAPAAKAAAGVPPPAAKAPLKTGRLAGRLLRLIGISLVAIPGIVFAARLIADHHLIAGLGIAMIVILMIAGGLTVLHIIAMVERERKERLRRHAEPTPTPTRATAAPSRAGGDSPGRSDAEDPPRPRRSQVETRFVRMTLDHGSGTMAGEIITGPERGQTLAALPLERLLELLEGWRQEDPTTAVVIESWLDRTSPDWRERRQRSGGDGPSLSREDATAILGLPADATLGAIKEAHRRLMARVHPDQGGSTWLASKVNEARDALLEG